MSESTYGNPPRGSKKRSKFLLLEKDSKIRHKYPKSSLHLKNINAGLKNVTKY